MPRILTPAHRPRNEPAPLDAPPPHPVSFAAMKPRRAGRLISRYDPVRLAGLGCIILTASGANVQFNGKLDHADLNDVYKITRTKMDWVKWFVRNLYALVIVIVLLWVTIAGALGDMHPNWSVVGIIWAALAASYACFFYITNYIAKRNTTKRLAELNATLPDRITLANDGVKLDGPNGANSFFPWPSFKGWRTGQRVILVDQAEGNSAVFLPIAGLSENERVSVQQLLQSQIPPPPN